MSAFPVVIEMAAMSALVVGGGRVGTRRALKLLEAGARVRVVDPAPSAELREAARRDPSLALVERAYTPGDVSDATLVVTAADSREVNAMVAAEARALSRLVNVADAADDGNWTGVAVLRAGDLVIAVSAGGVPGVAARVRDCLAPRFDARYGDAVTALRALRRETLRREGRAAWREAASVLIGEDFCDAVESGAFAERLSQWR